MDDAPSIVEVLDNPYPTLSRPLALIDGRAYAATWLYFRSSVPPRPPRSDQPVLSGRAAPIDLAAHGSSTAVGALTPPAHSLGRRPNPIPQSLTPNSQPRTSRHLHVLRDDGLLFGPAGDAPLAALDLDLVLTDPPDDGLLWSRGGIDRYRDGGRPEPADLFARLCAAYDAFVDFGGSVADQRTMCELSACLSLVTWLSDSFPLVPYLWLSGERGSGKTQLGTVWARTSYLGTVVLAGSSYAALRDLAQSGAALYVDDAEALAGGRRGDTHKRELLLAGNRRGARVAHKALIDGRWQTSWTSAYTPRAFSAIGQPDPTLASRAIVVPLARTLDATRAHRDPDDPAAWPFDLPTLRDDLWAFALAHLPAAADSWREGVADPLLVGREFDPWRPVLAVALLLEGASGPAGLESRLRDLMRAHQRERVEQPVQDETLEVVRGLVQAFESLFDQRARKPLGSSAYHSDLLVPTVLIAHAIAAVTDLPVASLDRAFTVRLGTILARLRLKPARVPGTGGRAWRVSCAQVVDIARSYGVPTTLDRFAPVTSVTSVTPSRG